MDLTLLRQCLITAVFIVGGAGNLGALWIIYKQRKTRNSKHVLLLRYLAANDLIAQVGMLIVLNSAKYTDIPVYLKCVLFVMVRAFGLGSGCVALIMAIERWLALTKPFFYQQYVTRGALKASIFILWFLATILTYCPLFGFGAFYQEEKCIRFREGKRTLDVLYCYVFLFFGTLLCTSIAFFNVKVYCAVGHVRQKRNRVLVRRVSRSTITQNRLNTTAFATNEELAFARLIAFICVVFLVCWLPQLISIPLGQTTPNSTFYIYFSKLADMLMCIYFALDPYIYVLHQYLEKGHIIPKFNRMRSQNTPLTPQNTPVSDISAPPSYEIELETGRQAILNH